ncbi:PREDICTED: cilia- and flagella-associated protein 58-like isoform X1 [Papilio xuthus]|uniref:Cilia- and flagella-associated protein 58-like isoform X1 n=1 Tax=Papilio xuthus TaxID=66420 RepID=A0AAJ6Z506_PAPXU|nr:PREDICTED: cilia- and flagella-associated protein 58-like isoform X1 [Papilio xuthus]
MEADEDGFDSARGIGSGTTEAEKEFEKVLEQLREAEGMKYYSDVYTKLYDSYFKLKEENCTQNEHITALKTKLGRFDDTVSDYITELSDAQKNIERLMAEIEEARCLADAMHARELASVESLDTMKKTLTKLEKELDARKRAGEDDAGATSAVKEKERFEKEKARLQGELDGIKLRLDNALGYIEDLEHRNTAGEESIAKLEEKLEDAENNAVRQNRLVDFIKSESATLKAEMEQRGLIISNLNDKLSRAEKGIERREKQLNSMGNRLELAQREQEEATARAATLREHLDNANIKLEQTKQTLISTTKELKNSTDDNNRMRNDISKLRKQLVQQTKKYQLLEQAKATMESERERLRQQVSVMEREIMLGNKHAEAERREIENLNREKDILNKNIQKIQNEAMENLQLLNLQEQRRKQLEHEVEVSNAQVNKQRLVILQMEKDKDRMLEETIALNDKIDEITEEVRLRTADILDLNKALREEAIKSRKLSVSLDATRTERNMLYKNYTEAVDEIQDLKQKLKMLAYQIEQLKEDISGKESGLKTCEGVLAKCNKKNEQLRGEVQAGLAHLAEARADITALRQEEARLNRIIQESDVARAKLMKDLDGMMNERDVVGAQLVRRNDEISLLYEKIRILEVTLHRGERQYEQRVEDIRLLRLEIMRLRKEKNLLSKGIENMTDLRLEVFNLERELGRSRLRVRALEEALETPLNVHRWRKLQGTDPDSVTLTHKLRLTQKKVLAQSEQLVLKDRELKETRNLYGAVKDMLALQPSPEIQQTLNRTQRALAQRTTKMKCLIAELAMRENQVTDLRRELDRTNGDLHSFKQKYYEMKRALDADEARRLKVPTPLHPTTPTLQEIT